MNNILKETDHRIDNQGPQLDYITGIINDDGEILASNSAKTHEILINWYPKNHGFSFGDDEWRIHLDDGIVRWWEHPTEIQKDLVKDFLNKWYHIKVKGHTLYQEMKIKEVKENISSYEFPHKFWLDDKGEIRKLKINETHDDYISKLGYNSPRDAYWEGWFACVVIGKIVYLVGNTFDVKKDQKEALEDHFYNSNMQQVIIEMYPKKKILMSKNPEELTENLVEKISNTRYNVKNDIMKDIKQLIKEGVKEKTLEDFIKQTIKGTEWEGKVFIAGGYVRDEFMGKDPKDLDLLVNSPNGGIEFAKWITKKVGAYRGGPDESSGSNPVIFPRFGTAKFNLRDVIHNGIDLSDMDIEAVMPRKEQYTAGSRKPTVTGGELKDDVERRDFTVNSLLKDLSSGEILDLTGLGKDDIKAGIVRTPLNPDKIFTDDPLRMLRAIRFTVKYNWKLPLFMIKGIKKNASQLKNISQERIRDELNKMLLTGSPAKAIKLLKVTDLLQYVIPELVPAIKMTQNSHHTQDVFHHTLTVLSKTQPILIQRLTGLFHDIGKTVTKSVTPTGVHFYNHEDEGEKIVDTVMSRLKYPTELINAVKLGVKNHMRLKQAGDTAIKLNDKTLLRFRNEMGEQLENVLNVIHADNTAHSDASSMPNQITNIRQRLEKLKQVPTKPKLPINGNDLQQTLGLKPGPIFKDIMTAVTDAWYQNPSLSKDEALEIAKRIAKI